MRFYQYLPWLENTGIHVVMSPLFSDEYVAGIQAGRKNLALVGRAYVHRIRELITSKQFDLLWIEKELLPWVPLGLENLLLPVSIPYILDYDDAVFHCYDQHHNPIVKSLLGNKHPSLIRGAALIIAGNDYLADFARQSGAKHVEIVPTVIDLERYPAHSQKSVTETPMTTPCVGWIGQRSTASFLTPYRQLFKSISSSRKARFIAVGIDAQSLGLPMESVQWTEKTEVASIARFDIGIMPLEDEAFARGKCGYKLIQYMACGLPVIASPVGVNCQIVEHGVNGFLAETLEQWQEALQTLLADAELRKRMGLAGREKVERQYCLQVAAPIMSQLLLDASETQVFKPVHL